MGGIGQGSAKLGKMGQIDVPTETTIINFGAKDGQETAATDHPRAL